MMAETAAEAWRVGFDAGRRRTAELLLTDGPVEAVAVRLYLGFSASRLTGPWMSQPESIKGGFRGAARDLLGAALDAPVDPPQQEER